MINTFYGAEQLVAAPTTSTFLTALLLGLGFGFALERAGFGSSRKLAGIFYFKDMTVLKVMFTALVTAMLGVMLFARLRLVDIDTQIYVLPSRYGAQILGGLIFGVGFVISGWCPGTSAVGAASGKGDAFVFLGGVVLGAIAYNETFGLTSGLLSSSSVHVAFGLSQGVFAFLVVLAALGAFYFAEWVEGLNKTELKNNNPYPKGFRVALLIAGVAVLVLPNASDLGDSNAVCSTSEQALLESVEAAEDHISSEELADALLSEEAGLTLIDVRPADEYAALHIHGALNLSLPELGGFFASQPPEGRVVLYSNGMTHPAQGRDSLARLGYRNVYILTDGLTGFREQCLKPVSLRNEPLSEEHAAKVYQWRAHFLGVDSSASSIVPTTLSDAPSPPDPESLPGFVETDWLASNLDHDDLEVIDCRSHADYTQGHIPGSVFLMPETFRGNVGGYASVVLPADLLAAHLSNMGISPNDTVVIAPGDSLRDAALIGMGLERLGHEHWGILQGGYAKWISENCPLDLAWPTIERTDYPAPKASDDFTIDADYVHSLIGDPNSIVIDVRPESFFLGEESTEARPGHVPGAVNRPYKGDLGEDGFLRPTEELLEEYRAIIPDPDVNIIVMCRTGHQASQTFFLLKHVLGYDNVKWYDASWSDWAARPELPAEM
jgi:3-mercaptopyruvate sulfurtransferase SseA/uncharacterized membrane protein YedE/YeeE